MTWHIGDTNPSALLVAFSDTFGSAWVTARGRDPVPFNTRPDADDIAIDHRAWGTPKAHPVAACAS